MLAIEQPNAQGDGATFDDVQVDNSGTIQIDPSELRVTLTISDGSTVTGGLLSIGPVGVLDVEGGRFSQEVLLDGVSVNNGDVINIGLLSTAIFTLDDGTTIEGGALTVNGGSALDVEYGSERCRRDTRQRWHIGRRHNPGRIPKATRERICS